MVQRIKNPNRNTPKERRPYVPEYRRLKISPIQMNGDGRVEEDFEQPSYGGLPLNVGQSDATYALDGQEPEFEGDDDEYYEPQPPPRPRATRPSKAGDILPGDFIALVKGQVIAQGSEDKVIKTMTHMIYNQEVNLEDIVLLRRMEVNFGISVR